MRNNNVRAATTKSRVKSVLTYAYVYTKFRMLMNHPQINVLKSGRTHTVTVTAKNIQI